MYKRIDDLLCNKVFKYFKDISNVPRESGYEKKLVTISLILQKKKFMGYSR